MGRTAVFIDAGYLFARGSEAIAAQTQQRHRLVLDEAKAVAALTAFADARSSAPGSLLRIYWYDATPLQGPNADHIRLAETDDVKLRLGVLNTFGQQKGVDSLIIADLIELARNRAIDTAVLMSGDDDLRVGVQVAQTFGVRVHLLGISGLGGEAQSKLLVREADTWTRWGKDDVAAFLSLREVVPPDAAAPEAPPAEESGSNGEPPAEAVGAEATLRATAERFLAGLQPADLTDIETVYEATRKVPYQYDKRLLATARTDLGRDLDVAESRTLRTFFLQALRRLRTPPLEPGAPG
jgi:uncharacterized LabA/DUF88 family protein